MRILFVHERFGALAGAEANVLATGTELKRRGHDLGILHGPGTSQAEGAWEETFGARFPLEVQDTSLAVNAALESFQPDLAYVHKLADLRALGALTSAGVPLVRMVHDHDLCCMRSYKYFYFTRRICTRASSPYCLFPCGAALARSRNGGFPLKWISYASKKKELQLNRQFDRLIVNSHYMRAELMRNRFPADKIELHAPVPPDSDPGFHSSFSDRNLIVYAGQIVRGKGVDVLLEALAKVRAPFECMVLGDGNHRPACEQLSRKLGLANRIKFTGYVRSEQLRDYYRDCSVVVMSSVWPEPFGMVGIEAMRYGLPVVAFDAGGIKEWLMDGRNGFVVPWMDRVAYAARVESLLNDKTMARQMGKNGRLLVSEHYDFSRYITGLEDLFARVVAETRGQVNA
jgi:glycosyltransferase involved in cell wall biosynthesis